MNIIKIYHLYPKYLSMYWIFMEIQGNNYWICAMCMSCSEFCNNWLSGSKWQWKWNIPAIS